MAWNGVISTRVSTLTSGPARNNAAEIEDELRRIVQDVREVRVVALRGRLVDRELHGTGSASVMLPPPPRESISAFGYTGCRCAPYGSQLSSLSSAVVSTFFPGHLLAQSTGPSLPDRAYFPSSGSSNPLVKEGDRFYGRRQEGRNGLRRA